MDDRLAAALADASLAAAQAGYDRLVEALEGHTTGGGFLAELALASQSDPVAFTRACNDPGLRRRAARLGVGALPTYATLPLPGVPG